MQISRATALAYGVVNVDTLFDPAVNIDIGTHLLSDLRASYGDDFRAVYSAYNSGSAAAWQTSAQVFANVQRALSALADYASQMSGVGTGSPGFMFLLLAGWWLWKKVRR